MRSRRPGVLTGLAATLALLVSSGCVERTARIETDPPGALVIVNDEEVGVSPVKFSFLWYGDYDLILRKPGFKTIKTSHRLNPPWYQWPPMDIVAEVLIPATIRDEHVLPTFELEPSEAASVEAVVQRATELRERSLHDGQ